MNETYERIAAELRGPLADRAPLNPLREQERRARSAAPGTWAADYGTQKGQEAADVFAPRLVLVGGGDRGRAGRAVKENSGLRGLITAFKSELAGWCIGTKVFLVCIAVAAFIVVV
jgi:hypothetical protein